MINKVKFTNEKEKIKKFYLLVKYGYDSLIEKTLTDF
jgi:hypothetical protein